ncbi:MAG: hypothetical protein N4A63_16430 [Vallitalea sp.]|jgi:hypothetical protein|nr:hypothetical protein [Vallitalea sp.]
MNMLKKILILMLSVVMLLPSTALALEKDIITEVEIVKSLNLLEGDQNGLSDSYLNKKTTRFQAAIMLLRLKGLEDKAKEFTGSENFEDATEIKWIQGQKILAYLKNHPELGWSGSNNNINPNGEVSAKAYYKVLLELLGYNQDVDFEWENVLEFANEKGLSKVADINELTNRDLAIATVEGLKANNSDGITFINNLVDTNIIDDIIAEQLGLYKRPLTSKMTSALAIDSTTVKLEFDKIDNIKAKDFKIENEESEEYEIENIEIIKSENAVVLTVDKLEIGNIYYVKYNGNKIDIVPLINEDKTQAILDSANAVNGELIRAIFNTRNIRKDSLIVGNFAISNGANVMDVNLDVEEMKKEGNHNKTIVLLDVKNLKSGIAYTLKSDSITSYNHIEAPFNTSSVIFAGKDKDTKAPKLESAKSINGDRVEIIFSDDTLLDEATLLNASNYSFNPQLQINDIKIQKNELNENKVVILSTELQKFREIYKLKTSNISDGINVMENSKEIAFVGVETPKNQKVEYAKSLTSTSIEIGFEYECNETALNIDNYNLNNDIQIADVSFKKDIKKPNKLDKKKIILITSSMRSGVAYKINVDTNVQNYLDQGLKDSEKIVFAGKDPDEKFTEAISAKALDTFTVKIVFDEKLDKITCNNIRNYKISNLGYPAKAVLSDNGKVVILTVPKQKSGIAYTITMNNIKDEFGNEIESNTEVIFAGKDR